MGEQLKLIRRADTGTVDISVLSLLDSTAIELAVGGWQPQVIPHGENEVEEAMTLVINGTSDIALASTLGSLQAKIRECEYAKDPTERYQVYLVDQLDGEGAGDAGYDRYAVVKSMTFTPGASLHDYYPVGKSHTWNGAQLGLVRGHWEDNVGSSPGTRASISSLGGTAGAGFGNDIPSRLARIDFTTLGGAQTEIWWGFKSERNVTYTNWTGLWEHEKGTAGTDTAATADATASGGTAMVCNFATNQAMTTRLTITPFQVSSTNYVDLRGSYKLLARMKVDSGYSCRVRSAYGLTAGTSNLTYNDPVTVSGTSWSLYDLGQVILPCGGAGNYSQSGSLAMKNSMVALQAQLYAGTQGATTYFHSDCFVAIPNDEGCGHIANGAGTTCSVYCDSLGRITAYSSSFTEVPDTTGVNVKDCVVPVENCIITLAGQRGTASVLNDSITTTFWYIPRWLTLHTGSAG